MEDLDAQKDEILALQSIFDENQILVDDSGNQVAGCIYVKPEIVEPLPVRASKSGQQSNDMCETFGEVENIYPLELHFNLPSDYPSSSPPLFTLVSKYLSREQLSKLCRELDRKWEEELNGQVVLFDWLQFLQYEALDYLNIKTTGLDVTWFYSHHKQARTLLHSEGHSYPGTPKTPSKQLDSRAVQDVHFEGDLIELLKDYDLLQKKLNFEKAGHECKVCFMEKMGTHCIQFQGCNHVYCKECMKGYFEVQIADGSVKGLICPEDKCTSQASPAQVKELVGPELFARYDHLLLQSTFASMVNLTYCPRPKCQYPVSFESETTMGSCPLCNFHFCLICKATYHGVATCKLTSSDKLKLFEAYTKGTDEEKQQLERRYGQKTMANLVSEVQAEVWIGKHSKQCPHCHAPIEKQDGCNKMSCLRCHTYFCWLCLAQLNPRCPYLHFSEPSSKCNLFEGIEQGDNSDNEDGDGFVWSDGDDDSSDDDRVRIPWLNAI